MSKRSIMPTYVMLTRLSAEALTRPEAVTELNQQVEDHVRRECPGVKWLSNYAVLGPCDYLDIFDAPDADAATKVSLLVLWPRHPRRPGLLLQERLKELATRLKG
jgi:uncharacterized protein with GYD domain